MTLETTKYLTRDSDHQACPPEGCIVCRRMPNVGSMINVLQDIFWKHPDGWVLYRLTRDMGCVRLTPEAAQRIGSDHTILNLRVLDHVLGQCRE